MHAHACMHVHVHVCGAHPLTTPHLHPPTPSPPQGGSPRITQNSIALELIKIFQFRFEDLKSVETSPPMGWCMVWWVDGWDQVKTLKI